MTGGTGSVFDSEWPEYDEAATVLDEVRNVGQHSVTWQPDGLASGVYYARVLEIPTPRWTAYEQVRFGIQMGDQVPMITQERAYTSPIWYTP